METKNYTKGIKALIVVDAQYDFMPATAEEYAQKLGGALAVTDGDKIIPIINKLLPKYELVIFTKDWHPEDMEAFSTNQKGKKDFDEYVNSVGEKDVLWPPHCIADTRGADIHNDINMGAIKGDFYIFKKGLTKDYHPYSGFGGTNLADFLREKNVSAVHITGLATDYCCKDTAIDAANEGFEVVFILDAMKPINPDIEDVKEELNGLCVNIVESTDLNLFDFMPVASGI